MRTSSFALASLLSLLAFDPIFSVEAQSEYWLTQYSPAIANAFTSLKISTARLSNNVAEDGYFKLHLPEGTDINYDPKSPFACNVSDYSPHGFNPATRQNIDTTVDFSGKTPTVMISPAEGTIFREKHGVSISCDNILLPAVVDHIDLKIGTQYNSSESAEVTIATDLDPLKYACPLSGARFSGNVNAEKADLLIKLRKSPFTHPADTKIRITPNFDIPADAPLSCVGYETKSEIVEGVLKYVELTPSKKIYADTNAVFKCGQITVPDVTDATVTVEVFQQNEKLLSSSTVPLTNPSLNDVGVLGGASANISLGPTLSGVALTLDLETVGVELVKGESILIPLHPESEPTDLVFTTTLKKSDAVFVGKAEYYVRDGFESTLAIRLTVESGVVQADDSFKVVIDSLTPPRYDTPIYLHILAADIEGKTKADVIVVSDDVKIIFPFAEDLTAAYSEKVGSKTSTLSITGTSTGLHMRENNSLLVQLPPKSNLISKSSKLVCACSTNELGCSQKYKAELLRPNTDDPALSITLLESSRIRNVDRFSIHCNGLDVPTTATTASKLNIAAYETADEKSRRLGAGTVNFQSAEDYSNIVGKAQTSYMKFADTIGSTTSSLKFNIEDVKTEVPANAVVVFKVPEFTEYTSKNPERNVSCTLNGENTEAKVILTKGSNSRVESIAVALPKGVKKSKNITIECEKFSVPLTASKAQKLDISIYKTYLENEKAVFARDVLDFKPAEVANVGSGENVNNNLNVYAPVTSTGIYSYFIGSSPVDIYPGAIFSFAVAASTPYPDVNMVSCFQASRKFSVTFDKDSQGMLSRVNAFFTSGPIMIRGLPIAFGCENLYISHHAVNPTTKYPTTISYKGTVFANGDLMMKNPAPPAAIGIKGGSHVKFLTSFDTKQDTSSVHFSISTVGVNVPNRSKITFALPEGLALRYSTKDSTKVLSNCKSATVKITSVKQIENRLYVGVVTNKDSKDEQNALYSNESFHMICDDVLTDRRTLDVLTTDVYIHDRQLPFTNAFGRGVLNIGRVVAADLGEVYSSISLLENYAVAEPSHFMATYYPLHVGLVAGDAISIQVPSLWIFPTFDPTSPDARVMINGEERHIFSTPDSVCWVSINDANPLTKTATARTEYIEMTSEAGADDYYRTLRVTLLESLPALDKVNNHYTVRVVCENVRPPVVVVSYRKPYTTAIHTARGDKLVQSGRMIVRDTPYLKPIVKTEVAKFVLQRPARRPFGDFETLSFITAFSKTLGGSSSNYSIMKQEIVPKKRKYQHHIDLIIRPSNKVEIDEAKAKLTHLVKVGFADFQNRLALEKVSKLISFDFAEYVVPEHCYNGIKDEDESDIDCGGACFACTTGKTCTTSTSCASGYCTDMKTFYFNAETKANVEETERICVDVANPSRQYSGPYY